jgi:hypothetical protein
MDSDTPRSGHRWIFVPLKILVSLCLIVWLSRKISFAETWRYLLDADLSYTLLAFVILGLAHFLAAIRWYFASTRLIPLGGAVRYTWIGQLYAFLLPGAVSADIAKGVVMFAGRDSECATTLASSILLDRLAGLGAILLVGLVAHTIAPHHLPISAHLTGTLAFVGAVLLVSFPVSLRTSLRLFSRTKFFPRLNELARRLSSKLWLGTLLLSCLIQMVNVTFFWVVSLSVGGNETWIVMAIFTCLQSLALVLPVSIAGIGIREHIALALFSTDADGSLSVAFAWLVLILSLGHALIGFALQFGRVRR